MLRRALLAFLLLFPAPLAAQQPTASLTVRVVHDAQPVENAAVRSGAIGALTGADGTARLALAAGAHVVVARRAGLAPDSVRLVLRAGQDTTVTIALAEEAGEELETVVVTATRGERRIEDEPVRVEVLAREEIEEKLLMTPGDIAMLLNETAGLRVQTTSPSLGGAAVRVQGLQGRYTQLLSDGLPLYGGQSGGLGLLQIPPMDLGQVEVIKGAASALYGATALGGVINLVSRRPQAEAERELLLNQTTRGGSDGVLWLSSPLGERWGYTLLGGAHYQDERDLDDDGWADLAGYRRGLVRPRLFWGDGAGRSLMLTGGATVERREGGTLDGRTAPDGLPFVEALDTERGDVGVVGRTLLGRQVLSVRGSAMVQRHEHRFGPVTEDDRHGTAFLETALAVPRERVGLVVGAALQHERYRSRSVAGFDFDHTTPGVFAQAELDPAPWLALSASARVDRHEAYGTLVNPRLSALLRAGEAGALAGWTARLSVGGGTFAPTPFTEETEVTGLTPLLPLGDLAVERATTASLDVGGALGAVEVNATVFGSEVRDPLALFEPDDPMPGSPRTIGLVNAAGPTRTRGGELLARYAEEPWHVTATYTYVRSTEHDVETGRRRTTPLVPRHAVGVVGMYEVEDRGRVGVELYYTGTQALDENPYRAESRPYVIVGALVERRVGRARLFVNLENLGNVRQTRYDPLVTATRGIGGRWTTDVWTELSGRTINGGVRVELP